MPNGNPTYDTVLVQVSFGGNGVTLITNAYQGQSNPLQSNPPQPTLAQALDNLSGKMRLAIKESLERALKEISELPAGHQSHSREAFRLPAMGDLSQIVFQPELPSNQVKISRSRATQFIFHSPGSWTFDKLGFFLDNEPLNPDIGIFTDRQISPDGHMLRITFVPNPQGPATRIKYNLQLITDVKTNNVFDGHAIIIVDPIIEKSLQ
jgi:hypothetical protein